MNSQGTGRRGPNTRWSVDGRGTTKGSEGLDRIRVDQWMVGPEGVDRIRVDQWMVGIFECRRTARHKVLC